MFSQCISLEAPQDRKTEEIMKTILYLGNTYCSNITELKSIIDRSPIQDSLLGKELLCALKDGTLGRMAIVEDTNICVNQSVAVLRCNKRVVPKILMYLLQMPEYQRDMISNAGGGTIKHIYITKVNKMQVAVPSMETQKKLLAFLGKIEKIKTTISHSLEQLETLKKALMQEYFG